MNESPPARSSIVSVIGLILSAVLIPMATSGLTAAASDVPPESAVQNSADAQANQVARDVFAGDAYWWKRTSDVKSTSAIGRFFKYIYDQVIRPILQWIGNALQWILERLLSGLGLGGGDWSKGAPFLWTIVIAIVLFVLWRIAMSFRRRPVVRRATIGKAPIDVLPQADQLLEQSRVALARGDHRSAVRLALLALLAWLQDRGRLKYDSSRSNREYQQDLRRWPDSALVFTAVAAPYERCWYGGRTPSDLQVQEVIALCSDHFQITKGSA